MVSESQRRALAAAGDQKINLPGRIAALKELVAIGDSAVTPQLKQLLDRSKPDPHTPGINFDPAGAERVIDLHAISALHSLGDDSEIERIGPLVAAAGRILQGPEDETKVAVHTIQSVGQVSPLGQLVELCDSGDPAAVRNAVRTLNQLGLPQPPVAGSFENIRQLFEVVSFEIHRFREELETAERLSRKHIVLSAGTRQYLNDHDYDRGLVKRNNVKLADFIKFDLDILDLTYYAQGDAVVICTYSEACGHWHDWWKRLGGKLEYSGELKRFVVGE